MLDVKAIRERPGEVERALADKGVNPEDLNKAFRDLVVKDGEKRRLLHQMETLKASRNRASEAIATKLKEKGLGHEKDIEELKARGKEAGPAIKALEGQVAVIEKQVNEILLGFPNLPHASVPAGKSDVDNVEVRRWGTPRDFRFAPKPHEEVGEALGLLDMERAAKIAKSRFGVLWGPLSRLSRALAQLMLDLHTREHGYTELWLPHLVSGETMLRTGQLPKFEEQLFKTVEADEGRTLYLIPTSEVPLTVLHAGEVLSEAALPRRYTAFTPCYRREAGTYGKDMKGIFRNHQFDKVELVELATPATAHAELESMVRNAETVLERLELPYRVVERCVGDLGFSAEKGYDLEVWLPGQGRYREISSCSSYGAFGGRRADIRYRPAAGGRPEFCATLNGSGLAVGRTLIAVLENYQEADGTVRIPEGLRPYMTGVERLTPAR